MTNFRDDLKLLFDIDVQIAALKNEMQMAEAKRLVLGAISPSLASLMPAANELIGKRIDVLVRAKARLEDLIDKEHGGGDNLG